jgi:hypothetical protein
MRGRTQQAFSEAKAAKPSKYRNVKVKIDGEIFDSKREAAFWQQLKLREKIGEIQGLQRQVSFPLYAPIMDDAGVMATGAIVQVSEYRADFVYFTGQQRHVVDAKGHRTKEYQRSKKWLFLQERVVIQEV